MTNQKETKQKDHKMAMTASEKTKRGPPDVTTFM